MTKPIENKYTMAETACYRSGDGKTQYIPPQMDLDSEEYEEMVRVATERGMEVKKLPG